MSETVLKIMLDEFKIVRIHCQGMHGKGTCQGVVEMSIENMVQSYKGQKCPLCGADIPNMSPNPLESLGKAILDMGKVNSVKVEFVIPQKD